MAWTDRALSICRKLGPAAKFAAKTVLAAAVPGSPAVVELVCDALDLVADTARDRDIDRALDASPADLERLEQVLAILDDDLHTAMAQVADLQDVPDKAERILNLTLALDERSTAALGRLDGLARRFDRLEAQNRELLAGQGYAAGLLEEMLTTMRRLAGIADYLGDLREIGLTGRECAAQMLAFQHGVGALMVGHTQRAHEQLGAVARALPRSASAAVALAGVEIVEQNLAGVEESLRRAARLRPGDIELTELSRQLTNYTRSPTTPGADDARLPHTGDMLDGWALEKLLGQGGWGVIFQARKNGQLRALKLLHPRLTRDEAVIERFKHEIVALKALCHRDPALVNIDTFSFSRDFDCWYFVMEFVDGMSLAHYLNRFGALSLQRALELFAALARGLGHVHAADIVHGDIKPANILLRADGSPVLIDFGLAHVDPADGSPAAGCSVDFAAPEQLRRRSVDARTDIYSLGATMYHALCFTSDQPPGPDGFDPSDVPEEVRPLLARAMHPRPDQRWANAGAFLAALGESRADRLGIAQDLADCVQASQKLQGKPYLEKHAPARLSVWQEAAEQGVAGAEFLVAFCHDCGVGVDQDDASAVAWYHPAAEKGIAMAQNNLGWMCVQGRGVPRDYDEALRWFRKAAEQDNAFAACNLGWMYEEGKGLPASPIEAVRWYTRAANLGHAQAQNNLGLMYRDGRGVKTDDREAIRWFRSAADQGNSSGMCNLGWMHEKGRGVPRSDAEAAKWYKKAADAGSGRGMNNYAWMLDQGRGMPRDEAEAIRWYRRAVEQNDALAQCNLGVKYRDGSGVKKDDAEAVRLFRMSAEQNNADGLCNLAWLYETGRGVARDLTLALTYYESAAAQGNAYARNKVKELRRP